MAEATDVCNAIANAIWAIIDPLVGTEYTIPEAVDAEAVGAQQTVPPTTVMLSRPLQKDLEDRLAAGKAMISVEPDQTDAIAQQYVNEGKKQDLIDNPAPTLTATPDSGLGPQAWMLGGTITVGEIIAVQDGLVGASYTVVEGDDLASVATNAAAAWTEAGIPSTADGEAIVVDSQTGDATVLVGAISTWLMGVSRNVRHFDAHYWCPDPYLRQFLVTQLESMFRPGQKLTMPDASQATMLGRVGSVSFTTLNEDGSERDSLFVARTRWLIEYVVTQTVQHAPILGVTVSLDGIAVDPSTPIPANML